MEEVALIIFLILPCLGGGLLLWRRIRGPAGSRLSLAARLLVLDVLLMPVFAFGLYRLMNARTYQVLGEIVPRVETSAPLVALTFDDGPAPEAAATLLPALRAEAVPATFFVVGSSLESNQELCRQMVGDGHELGNHTYSHAPMVLVSYDYIRTEIERTDQLIRTCGYRGPIQFRPPNFKKLFSLPYYLNSSGRKDILADVEPDSYPDVAGDADRITQYVLDHARPGSIILLHPWYGNRVQTLKALPGIVQGLKNRGYQFVTVSSLLASRSR